MSVWVSVHLSVSLCEYKSVWVCVCVRCVCVYVYVLSPQQKSLSYYMSVAVNECVCGSVVCLFLFVSPSVDYSDFGSV